MGIWIHSPKPTTNKMKKRIGYKATKNMRCRDLTYEVGKEYSITGKEICSYGFHYCKNLDDAMEYCVYKKGETVFIEIEDLDPNSFTQKDKTVSSKIRVLRIVDKNEFTKYKFDENDNLIENKLFVYTYDDKNRLVSEIEKDGDRYANGELIPIMSREYDEFGNQIRFNKYGIFTWEMKYNELGLPIQYKDSNGMKWTQEYDMENRTIKKIEYDGTVIEKWCDDDWNVIEYKDSQGRHYIKEYDEFGNLIKQTAYFKSSNTKQTKTWTYDDRGNATSFVLDNGGDITTKWRAEYDDQDREILYESDESIIKTVYDDGCRVKETTYLERGYDEMTKIIEKFDANGNLIDYSYTRGNDLIREWQITIE